MAKIGSDTIEKEAIRIVRSEKNDWEDATAFITEKVAFQMRNLIRVLRKNYWGVFDEPRDPLTGRKKVWIPLTESLVESVVKNIDLDTKDINFRAKTPKGYSSAQLARLVVRDHLQKIYFGEYLDMMERQIAIDGTAVWKTFKGKGKDGQPRLKIRNVDLLNFYIDPTAESIQDTGAVIERAVMSHSEFRSYDGWINKEEVEGRSDVTRNDGSRNYSGATSTGGETKYVEVFERWGLIPKWIITGSDDDKKSGEQVEGVIIVSNVDTKPVVHKIELNKDGIKPYEECWYSRVQGRWYGRGVAEKAMMLQVWLNTVDNIRINRSYVSQLGLFKIKSQGSVTPQMISKLGSNGAVVVNSMDDIEQMVVQEASQASYQDESVIQSWAERVTSAFDVVTGESLPASTPATNAVLQDRNAKSQFTLIKEGIGMFLQRWMDRHALPIIAGLVKEKDIVRITDEDILSGLFERTALFLAEKEVVEMLARGEAPDLTLIDQAVDDSISRLKKRDGMFIEVVEKLLANEIDTQVFITNEEIDTAVIVQNLLSLVQTAPQYQNQIVSQVFDLMGLAEPRANEQEVPEGEPQEPQGQPKVPSGDLQQITEKANLPLLNG